MHVMTLALRIVGQVKTIVVLHAYHVPYEGFVFAGTDAAPTDYHLAFKNRAGTSLARFNAGRTAAQACPTQSWVVWRNLRFARSAAMF